jgi:GntR family transcriptional regulator/MocR family aminotransferase
MHLEEISVLLDNKSAVPLYEQLYRHISREITQGSLPAGTRLPSRRRLSQRLGISQMTVESAFELLKAEGFLRSEPRRGLFVENLIPLRRSEVENHQFSPHKRIFSVPAYDFSPLSTDIQLFPFKPFTRLLRETLMQEPDALKRGHPQGDYSLREALAQFLYEYRGVVCQPGEIVIGYSVGQLLNVVAGLVGAGSTIAVEDPGYPAALKAFQKEGHQVVPIPLDEHGMCLEALAKSKASIAYVTPAHQYPLGISMPAVRRAGLLHWADSRQHFYLVEDDYDSEFRYASRPLPALHNMSGSKKVIYMSTFSRTLAPGIRLAYMVLPPKLIHRYQKEHLNTGESVSSFEQRAMARFLAEGHYVRHLRRATKVYQKRCNALVALLQDIPDAWFSGQEAGLHFVFGIHNKKEQELIQKAHGVNIPLLGLRKLCIQASCPDGLVLGFAGLHDHKLAQAVRTLREAWQV